MTDMLKMCEEEGLVHTVENKHGLGHVICNCDAVACGNWGHDRAYVKKFTANKNRQNSLTLDTLDHFSAL